MKKCERFGGRRRGKIIKIVFDEDKVYSIPSSPQEPGVREVKSWPEVAQPVSSRGQTQPYSFLKLTQNEPADFLPCPLPGQSKPEPLFPSSLKLYAGIEYKYLWGFFPVPFPLLSLDLSTLLDSCEVPFPTLSPPTPPSGGSI